jgi:ubiquinol-cytochrome c reductase cytochrome b subunit
MGIAAKAADYLERRLGVASAWQWFTDRTLPRGIGWLHTFGSATAFLLVVQALTGVFLAFYYVPSPEHAWMSVSQITRQLEFGWLVRGIHKWGASLVVVFSVLHMLRVFFMGAYKYPRELTWVVGVLLLLLVMAFGFTGYLLPWDQEGYWATVVGTHIAGYAPGIGSYLTQLLRGQPDVGVRTLGRFYAIHTLFLPPLLFSLVAVHLAMVIKQGIAPLPVKQFASTTREDYDRLAASLKGEGRPFYVSMAKDAAVSLLLLLLLFFMAWKLGAPLEDEADPTSATYVPRPEWYFYSLFELLWWFPGRSIPVATFWIPFALILVLIFLPWLDHSIHRAPARRPVTTGLATAVLLGMAFLTYKGATAPKPSTAATALRAELERQARSPLLRLGATVYEQQGCAACHTIAGAGGSAGPDLTGVGRKRDAAWLKKFVSNPSSVTPGTEMPPYGDLPADQLDALVAFLQSLK